MELSLQPDEVALLDRVLTTYLGDLRMEVSNTENYDLRQSLKRDEALIKAILVRLREGRS
ncbi:MAG: hypothetical protein HY331_07635 [Chloroflexi bacterium]|nr:hypothetical protein [Chloroflexota bacterium]